MDKWVKNNLVFICDGIGYTVTPALGTACIGPVDVEGNALGDVFKPPETPLADVDVVLKQGGDDNILTDDFLGSFETLNSDKKSKHPGGRPRKDEFEEKSRTTKWRRLKEETQGVLLDV